MEMIDTLTTADVPEFWPTRASLPRARKWAIVQEIHRELEKVFFIMAFNIEGVPDDSMEVWRETFPTNVKVRKFKNRLFKQALERTPWIEFGSVLKGSNMFVFVYDDADLKPTIEAYLKGEKKYGRAGKVAKMQEEGEYSFSFTPLTGGMLDGEFEVILPEDIPKFKNFPTRLELIGRIAGGIKQVTQKVAVGINQLPKKIAVGTKKIVEKMEEEGKATVADVVA